MGEREPATWREALGAARTAWPRIAIDLARFEAHAEARRLEGARAAHLVDLYLAYAAVQGDAAALAGLDELIREVRSGVDGAPSFQDELRQAVRVHLLVGEPPRLAAYRGRGPLQAWLRVVATRLALNLLRGRAPVLSTEELLGELVATEPDPELRHLKDLHRAEFGQALREALTALPDRQRAILRLHFVDGLRLARIAELYAVHESTASRWVAAAAAAVASDARRRLRERLMVGSADLDSVARMVASQLDLSISRILRG